MQISTIRSGLSVTQMLKTMKLTALFLFVALLQVSANTYSQKVTLRYENVGIEKVLKEIRKQTGYLFFYKTEELKKAGKISVNVTNTEVTNALKQGLASTNLTFNIVDRTIILKPLPMMITVAEAEPSTAFADLTGQVTDGAGLPLAGANIRIKGTKLGTATDQNGRFSLKNVPDNAILEISFIGYASREVNVSGKSQIDIQLQLAANKLDETVIIAYGKTSKRLNTGSVASISNETIERQPVSDPLGALQGRVSGLMITASNGMPGSSFKVRVRGENSMKQGNDPLYIIDGVPYISGPLNQFDGANGTQSPLNSINPNDIDRIDVLKDADATSIYGSRGANGVVLITTKKGTVGDNRVSFNLYTGITKVANKLDLMNTEQYLQMRKDAFRLDSATPTETNAPDLLTWDKNAYTDWQDLLIGNTGTVNAAQVSFTGGNSQTRFLLSTSYRKETSVILGNLAFDKGGALLSVNHNSKNNKFGLTANANFVADNNNTIPTDITQYIYLPPNYPQYNSDGSIYWFGTTQNPLAYLNRTYNTKTTNLIGSGSLRYTLIKGFDLKSNFGYTYTSMAQVMTLPQSGFNPVNNTGSSAQFGNSSVHSFIAEPQVTYNFNLGDSKIDLLGGVSWQQSISQGQFLLGSGFSSDALLKNIASASQVTVRNASYSQYNYQSLFGRVNYNYLQKYLLNLTFRRDGSSRFGPGKQFGNFGAMGAAWIFSEENFMSSINNIINYGKIRASYGTSGNDQIGDYQYLDSWSSAGFPYGGVSGLAPSRVFNPDYSWEVNKKFEMAIELGMVNNRILLSTGYYNNRSSNQLIGFTLSPQAGFSEYTANLPAKVENKGWEIDVNTINIKNSNFKWQTNFNISIPSNILLEYPNLSSSADAASYEVGKSIRVVKGFHFTGVDPLTGTALFLDVNKNGSISSPADYLAMGQTMPKFFGGFGNEFTYKNFGLDIFFQFVKQEAPTMDYGPLAGSIGSMNNKEVRVLDYWKQPGDITAIPRPTITSSKPAYTAYMNNYRYSDGAWGDASFIRLKNVSLTYDVSSLTEKWKVQGASIYLQAQNLLTFTKYNGLDPEVNGFDRRFVYPVNPFGSVRPTAMPALRTFTVGIKFSL